MRDSLDELPSGVLDESPPSKATVENENGEVIDVVYDPVLRCYYDPHSNSYYDMKWDCIKKYRLIYVEGLNFNLRIINPKSLIKFYFILFLKFFFKMDD